jgi:predicted signal transduction protein with EAL and GGDEF domain
MRLKPVKNARSYLVKSNTPVVPDFVRSVSRLNIQLGIQLIVEGVQAKPRKLGL